MSCLSSTGMCKFHFNFPPFFGFTFSARITCKNFLLCFTAIVFLFCVVSRFFVVFMVILCFMSLVSFTGSYTEDGPNFFSQMRIKRRVSKHWAGTTVTLICTQIVPVLTVDIGFVHFFKAKIQGLFKDFPGPFLETSTTSWNLPQNNDFQSVVQLIHVLAEELKKIAYFGGLLIAFWRSIKKIKEFKGPKTNFKYF